MKKQLVAPVKLRSLFFTTATILLLGTAANAQSAPSKVSLSDAASVKHLGSKEESPLFHVQIPNQEGEKFSLVIKDAKGATLFHEVYTDKNFDKKFLITDVENDEKLLFTVYSFKNKDSQTFEANAVTHIIDDVVVTKL